MSSIQEDFISFFSDSIKTKTREIKDTDRLEFYQVFHENDVVFYMFFNTEELQNDFMFIFNIYLNEIRIVNDVSELEARIEAYKCIVTSLNNFLHCISSDFNILYNYFSSGQYLAEIDLIEFKYNAIMSAGKNGTFGRAIDYDKTKS